MAFNTGWTLEQRKTNGTTESRSHNEDKNQRRGNRAGASLVRERRRPASTESAGGSPCDFDAAISQLKAWAQAGKLIRFESGTSLSAVNFMARLVPGADDSFVVRGAAEFGAAGMGGGIYPSEAEYVRVSREESHVAVILRRLGGSICVVFDDSGRLEKLLRAQPATPLTN
jgi:hypothetical protein